MKFLGLTKEQIVNLTGMKVGPSLKIYDLIQALKVTVVTQQQQAANRAPSNPVPQPQMTASSLLKQQGLLHGGSPSTTTVSKAQLLPSQCGGPSQGQAAGTATVVTTASTSSTSPSKRSLAGSGHSPALKAQLTK